MEQFITVERARELILADVKVPLSLEKVDLLAALGRILGENIIADRDLPPLDNSAMDGYALISADSENAAVKPVPLPVIAEIPAGQFWNGTLETGQAIRIMTGAPLPAGADAVVRREYVDELGDKIVLKRVVAAGNDIRRAGEDVAAGNIVLNAGDPVTPAVVGMLAAVGVPYVSVIRRPRVAILATGDEIIDFHQPPGPGLIRNSNSYSMAALVIQAGGLPQVFPITGDDPEEVRKNLQAAAESNDVVVSSGGVSMGDYDYLKDVLGALPGAEIRFWQVRMKPGKPLLYGRYAGKSFFGLPGNPVSTMVSFEQFVRPAMKKMSGWPEHQLLLKKTQARAEFALPSTGKRRHYVRGRVEIDENGLQQVTLTGAQGSGILNSMVRGNCLVPVEAGSRGISVGDQVEIELLDY